MKPASDAERMTAKEVSIHQYEAKKANNKLVTLSYDRKDEDNETYRVVNQRREKNLHKAIDKLTPQELASVQYLLPKQKHHKHKRRPISPGPWEPGRRGFLRLYGGEGNAFATKHETLAYTKGFENKSVTRAFEQFYQEDKIFARSFLLHNFS